MGFVWIWLICTMVSWVKGPFSTCLWWPLHLDNWYLSLCIGHGGDSHAVPVLLVKVKYSVYIIYFQTYIIYIYIYIYIFFFFFLYLLIISLLIAHLWSTDRGVGTVRHFRHVPTHNFSPNICLLMKNDKQRITYFNYVCGLN